MVLNVHRIDYKAYSGRGEGGGTGYRGGGEGDYIPIIPIATLYIPIIRIATLLPPE